VHMYRDQGLTDLPPPGGDLRAVKPTTLPERLILARQ